MQFSRESKLTVLLVSISLFVTLGLCELAFRILLFSDHLAVPTIRQAWRFADGTYEDDFWKLQHIFDGSPEMTESDVFDPLLGWAPAASRGNSLRLVTDDTYDIERVKNRPVLFYGDSFVAGITAMEHRIPQVMNRLLPETTVLNYGMSGYGVDQIYLRYTSSVEHFENPIVLIGLLTRDLDRSVLSFRSRQKPYFELEGDHLVLRNSPITATTREFFEKNPPEIRSYFARFVLFRLRNVIPDGWFDKLLGFDEIEQRKIAVNSAILRDLARRAIELENPVHIVLFYNFEELREKSWRETFLKEKLDSLGIEYIDTKPLLLESIDETGFNIYDDDHGHLNQYGNWLVADHIAAWLRQQEANVRSR